MYPRLQPTWLKDGTCFRTLSFNKTIRVFVDPIVYIKVLQSREFQQEYNELCFNWPEYEWGIVKEFPVHIGSTVAVFYSSCYIGIIVPYFDYIHADSGIMILYIWPFMEGSYTMHTLKNTFIEWAPAVPEWIKEMTICILDLNWYHITTAPFPDRKWFQLTVQ